MTDYEIDYRWDRVKIFALVCGALGLAILAYAGALS